MTAQRLTRRSARSKVVSMGMREGRIGARLWHGTTASGRRRFCREPDAFQRTPVTSQREVDRRARTRQRASSPSRSARARAHAARESCERRKRRPRSSRRPQSRLRAATSRRPRESDARRVASSAPVRSLNARLEFRSAPRHFRQQQGQRTRARRDPVRRPDADSDESARGPTRGRRRYLRAVSSRRSMLRVEPVEQRLPREVVLRVEVRVEAADRQAGAFHHRVDRRRFHTAFLQQAVRCRQYPGASTAPCVRLNIVP